MGNSGAIPARPNVPGIEDTAVLIGLQSSALIFWERELFEQRRWLHARACDDGASRDAFARFENRFTGRGRGEARVQTHINSQTGNLFGRRPDQMRMALGQLGK